MSFTVEPAASLICYCRGWKIDAQVAANVAHKSRSPKEISPLDDVGFCWFLWYDEGQTKPGISYLIEEGHCETWSIKRFISENHSSLWAFWGVIQSVDDRNRFILECSCVLLYFLRVVTTGLSFQLKDSKIWICHFTTGWSNCQPGWSFTWQIN